MAADALNVGCIIIFEPLGADPGSPFPPTGLVMSWLVIMT